MKSRIAAGGLGIVLLTGCPDEPGGEGGSTGGTSTSSGGSPESTAVPSGEDTITAEDEDTGTSGEVGESTFGCELMTFYPDVDEDGYGDINFPVEACLQHPAHIPQGGDCDDANPEVHPGIEEVCDDVDNDCDTIVDEASPSNANCQGCTLGQMGTHAYFYCPMAMAQPDAQVLCEGLGTDLLKIDDQAEQDFLLAEPLPAAPLFYIGLSDVEVEGTFVWPDGSAPDFTAWGRGEPNDALEGEDCVQLAVPAGTWNDIACMTATAFICEGVEA